jgi:hypothetical protein
MEAEREIPDWIVARLKIINKIAWRLYAIHYFLGGLSIILTITIASKLTTNNELISIFAWIAAISVGLNTFIRPAERAKIYREAWLELQIACSTYLRDIQFTLRDLESAFENGWKNIVKSADKLSKQELTKNV